jgi:hypothetical protein
MALKLDLPAFPETPEKGGSTSLIDTAQGRWRKVNAP